MKITLGGRALQEFTERVGAVVSRVSRLECDAGETREMLSS